VSTQPWAAGPQNRPGRLGVGVIGAGKVGAVLGAALRNAGHAVTGVHAVSEASRSRAESLLPEVPVLEIPEILRRSEMVLLAVPDDVLPDLVSGLAEAGHFQTGHLVVHTSGAHGVSVLDPVRASGAIPLAIHPVMSFTGLTLDLARLQDCMFGVTADPIVLPVAQALVVEMGGEPAVIAEADRGTYHAALAHASNHLVTLTAQAAQILASIGVEQTDRMLSPLLNASLENALANGDGALTGPVARGDVGTVRRHLQVLAAEGIPADVGQAYRAMATATAQRALARGALSEARVADLLDLLDQSPR
jgi:predicted short-subunit dehydrogenase-like oxidoreductase (DUF2520 family)